MENPNSRGQSILELSLILVTLMTFALTIQQLGSLSGKLFHSSMLSKERK